MTHQAPYPHPSNQHVAAVMAANRKRDTKPEVALRSALHRHGLRFRKHRSIHLRDLKVSPDIVFVTARTAIFIDGCFWHRCEQHGNLPRSNVRYWSRKLQTNVDRDRRVTVALQAEGWKVLRIWEHEDIEEAVSLVIDALAPHTEERDSRRRGAS